MFRCLPIFLLFILCMTLSSCATGTLKPFESDGCSMCPDGSWGDCCVEHDVLYWQGGTMKQRWDADVRLFSCVRKRTNFVWAGIMFLGVRIGGFPYWPLPWRWGFGWGYPKGYGKLSPEDKAKVDDMLEEQMQSP